MKKIIKNLGAFLIASTLLISCNGSNSQEQELKDYENNTMERIEKYQKMGDKDNDVSNSSDDKETVSKSGSTSNCEQFCTDYEEFANEYVLFMKKYKANPSDMTILSEYSEMTQKALEMQESSKDCAADPVVAARVTKALSKIAKAAM